MRKWTDAQNETLMEHFNRVLSTRESANALAEKFGGRWTRNMVIGRLHRIGVVHGVYFKDIVKANEARANARQQMQEALKQKREALRAHRLKKQAEIQESKTNRAERAKQAKERRDKKLAEDRTLRTPLTALSPITRDAVMSLNARSCRYPIGSVGVDGFHFCCEPQQAGSSYCRQHHQLCNVVIPIKRRPDRHC